MYMRIVMTNDPRYIDSVDPINSVFHTFESVDSTFSKQYSAQV